MPDGIRIAVNVRLPDGYVPGRRYPTVLEMSGYDGGSAQGGTLAKDLNLPVLPHDDSRQLTRRFDTRYVTVHASVRGTGCSGGEFDLFSWRSAEDGRHLIDEWIARQPWSNGDVALMGHSYSGITGFLIAATGPRHLRAATLSGLVDDLYRGLVYPGGVSNYGFPVLWTGGVRPALDVGGGLLPGLVRPQRPDDVADRQLTCAEAATTKRRTIVDDPLVRGLDDTDGEWWRVRSPITYAGRIQVPVHITGAHQDEQTGARGPAHLWEKLQGVPKRLVLTNGNHATPNPATAGPDVWRDRVAWVDHWMGVAPHPGFGTLAQRRTSVTTLLEVHRDATGALVPNGRLEAASFPLETTRWTDWFLRAGGRLVPTGPAGAEPADTWVAGAGSSTVVYRSDPLTASTAVVGPITATLFVSSTAPETELFVELADEGPDGRRSHLQHGLLRASHRAVDVARSDHAGRHLYRPWRPHTEPTPIAPLRTYEYLVEVFPVGHVFRAGHRIVVEVHGTPLVHRSYAYVSRAPARLDTVFHDPARPSRITLPLVPLAGVGLGPELPCGAQEAVPCA